METSYRKKLIEVALPLVSINRAAADEKAVPRHGHPQTLHLWWARRPLAACRAVLFCSLVDDPDSDPAYQKADGKVDEDRAGLKRADLFNFIEELVMWENSNNSDVICTARAEIARCVASRLIETGSLKKDAIVGPNTTAYDLVKRGHCKPLAMGYDKKVGQVRFSFDVSVLPPPDVVNAFLAKYAPPVLDPFAGGGSIPLEAQRLGLRVYASDLNPVPVLINKALVEIPPNFAGRAPVNPKSHGEDTTTKGKGKKQKSLIEMEWHGAEGLAEDVRYYGQWVRDEAEKRIGPLYPKVDVTKTMAKEHPDLLRHVGEQLTVIAWIWARTVASPNPAADGAHVPLVRSFWLSTKKGNEAFAQPIIDRARNTYRFEIRMGTPPSDFDPNKGTVIRTGATCLLTGTPVSFDHVRAEGKAGRLGTRLMAVIAEGRSGRVYLPPLDEQVAIAESAQPRDYPDSDLPKQALSFRVMLYGMDKHFKLFSARQLVAMTTFSDLLIEAREKVRLDATQSDLTHDSKALADNGIQSAAYADAVVTYLAFAISKLADWSSSLCGYIPAYGKFRSTFGKQAIPMVWDFAEVNVFGVRVGNWSNHVEWVADCVADVPCGVRANVRIHDAASDPDYLLTSQKFISCTDPPYYDNIGYADLSDFFYVWLRRSLGNIYPSLFATMLTPKTPELIASPYRHDGSRDKAKSFFEQGFEKAFRGMRANQHNDYPLTVFYAFKQSETDSDADDEDNSPGQSAPVASTGWETMLTGLVRSGFSISGTWPIRTERGARSISIGTNSLASSIVLVCRPRSASASPATRKEFLTAMRRELPEALRNLQRGNIAPVDLAQAAIGPGMTVFTRYAKVIESDGSPMTVRTALGLINQTLDEVLAEQEGEFDGDTRWALAWFDQYGMDEGPFGDAETLSKAKNTAVNGLVEAGIITAHAGKVRLLRRDELPVDWNPATEKRLTVWEVTQHMIRTLDQHGELGAATVVQELGGIAEISRDLAYRLYSTCERKKWSQEAMAYNSLVVAWSELTKLALSNRSRQTETQKELFA
jgi:putative DNA methylase